MTRNRDPHTLSARTLVAVTAALLGAGCATDATSPPEPRLSESQASDRTVNIDYDSKDLAEYAEKWGNPYGLLEMGVNDTRSVSPSGEFSIRAIPFTVGADFSVFDHLKYIAISNREFQVPEVGSLTFSVDIEASTPGTQPGRVVRGCHGGSFSYTDANGACLEPWTATPLEGQQAGVVLNMINFATGQLFDWFVSENEVFALVERLPSLVTNPALQPGDAGYVGLDKAYTQIVKRQAVQPGRKHRVAMRYTRGPGVSRVEFFLNGSLFATVDDVGVPLDVQGAPYTGIYPSYGRGEVLNDELDSFVMAHGLFSLLDAFPFQHPERPDLSVSIPMSERLFGQGAAGTFKNFRATIRDDS